MIVTRYSFWSARSSDSDDESESDAELEVASYWIPFKSPYIFWEQMPF